MKFSLSCCVHSLAPKAAVSKSANRSGRTFICVLLAAYPLLSLAQAPGSPDSNWNVAEVPDATLAAMAMQADGKVLTVGYETSGVLVVRFDTDGDLDTAFGTGGMVHAELGTQHSPDYEIAVAPDGSIYVAGPAAAAGEQQPGFVIARFLGNGGLDNSYGVEGLVEFSLPGAAAGAGVRLREIALQPGGRLIVLGDGPAPGAEPAVKNIALIRFAVDGQPDATFGTAGSTIIPLATTRGFARALQVAADGALLIAANNEERAGGFLVKLTAAGNYDTTFGAGGNVNLQPAGLQMYPTSLALQADGKIVVAVAPPQGLVAVEDELALVRLTAEGALDTQFGTGGYSLHDLAPDTTSATALAIEANGKILVTGSTNVRGGLQGDAFLLRLLDTGQPDTGFAAAGLALPGGYAATDLLLNAAGAAHLLIQNVAGPALNFETDRFSVRKFSTQNPTQAPSFTISGGNRVITDTDGVAGEIVNVSATATDSDGSVVRTRWLTGDSVLANGTSAALALSDGTTVISFQAVDEDGASSTASVTYTIQAPINPLPRISSLSSLQAAGDSEFSIAIRSATQALVASAPITEALGLTGYIFPKAADRNLLADIFVVAATPLGWFMRNLDGMFVPWNGAIASLVPAYERQPLTAQLRVNIFAGRLPVTGTYSLHTGYMRIDGSELIYTARPETVLIKDE